MRLSFFPFILMSNLDFSKEFYITPVPISLLSLSLYIFVLDYYYLTYKPKRKVSVSKM